MVAAVYGERRAEMKKIVWSLLLIVLVFAGTGMAAEDQKEEGMKEADGHEWVSWNLTEKRNFAAGFIAGSFYMVKENFSQPPTYNEEKFTEMAVKIDLEKDEPAFTGEDLASWSKVEKAYLIKEKNDKLLKYIIRGLSNAQIINGLDALYEDSNNRPIKIADAFYVIKKKITSQQPQEEIDRILLYLREGKKDHKYLKVENGKGELAGFIQFP